MEQHIKNDMENLNYERIFNKSVVKLKSYCIEHKIKSLVLGISGGIDSTVVAAIAREVCDSTNIPLIGRSLPIKNENAEFHTSELVGKAFCDDFAVNNLFEIYNVTSNYLVEDDWRQTSIANGNLQARLRMMYLYNLASINNGMVLSTDNQTEYQLGFWTIHGDVGDYDPIQALWKTEVYGLAKWLLTSYNMSIEYLCSYEVDCDATGYFDKQLAMETSMRLIPTDGLGISNSDLDQIGAKSYEEVDDILRTLMSKYPYGKYAGIEEAYKRLYELYSKEVVDKVWDRHLKSEFKRLKAPISVPREDLL